MALEPITRKEKIIAGQDLTPITRLEKFLKNFGGGGGSVPKPLTYDYMPAGYPSKTVQTTTLMEDQELAFELGDDACLATLADGFEIAEGQTYTVKWDGTEYKCVCSLVNGVIRILGNLSIVGGGDDTGEPFVYVNNPDMGSDFCTLDTAPSHTISVTTTEEVITPMAEEFLPDIVAEIKETADNAQTAAETAQNTANNAKNIASEALPLSGGVIRISKGGEVATLKLNEFTSAAGVQKRGIQIGGSGAYGYPILEVTHDDITIYDDLAQRRIGGLNSEELFLKSKNSVKIFKITVDDSGTISATEVT